MAFQQGTDPLQDFKCIICLTVPQVPAVHSLCLAVFCLDHLTQCFTSNKQLCPKCRQPIVQDDLQPDSTILAHLQS